MAYSFSVRAATNLNATQIDIAQRFYKRADMTSAKFWNKHNAALFEAADVGAVTLEDAQAVSKEALRQLNAIRKEIAYALIANNKDAGGVVSDVVSASIIAAEVESAKAVIADVFGSVVKVAGNVSKLLEVCKKLTAEQRKEVTALVDRMEIASDWVRVVYLTEDGEQIRLGGTYSLSQNGKAYGKYAVKIN